MRRSMTQLHTLFCDMSIACQHPKRYVFCISLYIRDKEDKTEDYTYCISHGRIKVPKCTVSPYVLIKYSYVDNTVSF